MARVIGKLNSLAVDRAKRPGRYNDGGGLYLLVSPAGSKSWVFRFRKAGKLREMGLGALHTIGLAEARQRAQSCRRERLDGFDPIEVRKADRQRAELDAAKAMTFEQCAERYIDSHKAGWHNPKHAGQWSNTLATYVFPVLGHLPVQAIDVGLVMKAIEPIWTAKPETASRVRGRIESVLDWATARGYRQGENPARWRGHLDKLLPKKTKVRAVEHHAALYYDELPGFMAELRRREGIFSRALEFLILTAARTGEVRFARWDEIDLHAKTWVIPAERMKAKAEHRVPLSDRAIEILDEMATARQGPLVFPGAYRGSSMSNAAMLRVLAAMGRGDLTAHGFRSTFSDWCSERTSFAAEVREMALAHTIESKVEAAYRRGDLFEKRRRLMDTWASFATSPTSGNVVPIAASR
jgi:integrase